MPLSNHRNNFNLLRLVFASLVIVSHAAEMRDGNRSHEILTRLFGTISFGELAVDCFFVLSGYLILKSWVDKPKAIAFVSSRVLRIYPGFVAAALLCAFVVGPLYPASDYFRDFHWGQFFSTLIRLGFRPLPPVFPGTYEANVNASIWTIPYEFKCYLFVLVLGILTLAVRRFVWALTFIACLGCYVAQQLGLFHVSSDFFSYVRFLMAFSAGGCFFAWRNSIRWRSDYAAFSALALLPFMFSKTLCEPALCTLGAFSIIQYALAGRHLLAFNKLPDVSYGVYLYAWPINKVVLWYWPHMHLGLLIALVFVLSLIAGMISWYAIERPFMNLKRRLRRQQTKALPIPS